jgi:hypothetical protein
MQVHESVRLLASRRPQHPPTAHLVFPSHDDGTATQNGGGGGEPLLHEVSLYPPQHGTRSTSPATHEAGSIAGGRGERGSLAPAPQRGAAHFAFAGKHERTGPPGHRIGVAPSAQPSLATGPWEPSDEGDGAGFSTLPPHAATSRPRERTKRIEGGVSNRHTAPLMRKSLPGARPRCAACAIPHRARRCTG